MTKKNKKELRKKAPIIIKDFFEKAKTYPDKADLYVRKARNFGMSINYPIPINYKRKFCKNCYSYFKLGNYRVRTRDSKVIYFCFKCKKYMKFLLKPKPIG